MKVKYMLINLRLKGQISIYGDEYLKVVYNMNVYIVICLHL